MHTQGIEKHAWTRNPVYHIHSLPEEAERDQQSAALAKHICVFMYIYVKQNQIQARLDLQIWTTSHLFLKSALKLHNMLSSTERPDI